MAIPQNDYTSVKPVQQDLGRPSDNPGPTGPPTARATAFANEYLPGGAAGTPNPNRAFKDWRTGKNIPHQAMQQVQIAGNRLGYYDEENKLKDHYNAELDNPNVDLNKGEAPTMGTLTSWAQGGGADPYHRSEAPTIGRLSAYVQDRLGVGLTPDEENAIRGRMRDSTEGSAMTASRDASSRMAAAGIDPRSGIGNVRAGAIAAQRAQGNADTEREVTMQDLARKRDMEGLATTVGSMEEGRRASDVATDMGTARMEEAGRQYDTGAQQSRKLAVENGMGQLSSMAERQRQYDIDYTESARQARKSRKQWRDAASALEPTTWEQVSGSLDALNKGVIQGYSGGGGGGM